MVNVKKQLVSWSGLPLLPLASIAKFLKFRIDLISFRSVCSSWRNSIPCSFLHNSIYPINNLPLPDFIHPVLRHYHQPKMSEDEIKSINFTISQSIIYLLKPTSSSSSCSSSSFLVKAEHQLVKIEGKNQHKVTISNLFPQEENSNLNKVLDLRDYHVFEICRGYNTNRHEFNVNYKHAIYRLKKVIVYPDFDWSTREDCTIFAITELGHLGYWRFDDENWVWTTINKQFHYNRDMIIFKEQIYVVDEWGTLFVIDFSSMKVKKVAAPHYEHGENYLVESGGDLYLVERKKVGDVRIYKFNDEKHDWDLVISVEDRLFFVGSDFNYSFSTSAQDFSGAKGSCIVFNFEQFTVGEDFVNIDVE